MSLNLHCNGEFFSIGEELWYRCWWDGKCIAIRTRPTQCPYCNRDVASESLRAETREAVTRVEPRTIVSYVGSTFEFEMR